MANEKQLVRLSIPYSTIVYTHIYRGMVCVSVYLSFGNVCHSGWHNSKWNGWHSLRGCNVCTYGKILFFFCKLLCRHKANPLCERNAISIYLHKYPPFLLLLPLVASHFSRGFPLLSCSEYVIFVTTFSRNPLLAKDDDPDPPSHAHSTRRKSHSSNTQRVNLLLALLLPWIVDSSALQLPATKWH